MLPEVRSVVLSDMKCPSLTMANDLVPSVATRPRAENKGWGQRLSQLKEKRLVSLAGATCSSTSQSLGVERDFHVQVVMLKKSRTK